LRGYKSMGCGWYRRHFVSPEGRILVVDGGAYADGEFLRRFLKALGGRVDYWFVTHAHANHFGALVEMNRGRDKPAIAIGELLFSFPERGWMERSEKTAAEEIAPWYDEFMAGIGAKIPRGDCSPGRRIALGSWSFEILNPPHLCEIRGPLNNSTVCLSVDAGGKRWLVTGDIAEDGQQALLSSLAGRERHDVVFMSHHGQHGANKDFYARVAPEIAVWPTTRWLWDNHPKAGTVGGGPWRTNYVKCWLQELGVKRQYLLDHDVVFE
jgi:beta-lactamase superfamily II metal-dependent hydrolase